MKSAKRIISACLTATLVFQAFAPSTSALAEEVNAASSFAAATAGDPADVTTGNETEGNQNGGAASGDEVETGGNAGSVDAPTGDGGSSRGDDATGAESSDNQESAVDAQAPEANEAEESTAAQQDTVAAVANTQITTVQALRDALGSSGSVEATGETATKITFKYPRDLCIISNADPAIYRTAVIEPDGTTGAAFDLTTDYDGYSFQGFGSDTVPFEGSFNMGDITIQVARSFYNNIALSGGNKDVKLTWKGTSNDPVVAKKITGRGLELNAAISIADTGADGPKESDAAITSALVGEVSDSLSLKASYSFTGTRKGIGVIANDDNAGLLVNTLSDGASLTINGVDGLDSANSAQSIKATNGNAGGLIGAANDSSTINVNTSVDVSKLIVTSTSGAAGGFIGCASNVALSFADGTTVHPALEVGDANTDHAGGAIGKASFKNDFTVSPAMFSFGENGDSTVELGAKKRAGGLFGLLDLTSSDVTVQGGTFKSKLIAAGDNSGSRGGYGGIAGDVCSNNDADGIHALTITNSGDNKASVEIEKAANIFYTGGIVGYLGGNLPGEPKSKVACILDGAQVTCNGNATVHDGNAKYGGAVGVVDTNQVLDVRDFKIATSDSTAIGQDISSGNPRSYKDSIGGVAGIAGSAWRGIIKFSGTTDLSGAKFANNDKAAQLLYQNYNALVFATGSGSDEGWKYLRPDEPVAIDDIYDYGQVVRLGGRLSNDLIKVDENTHKLELGTALGKTDNTYVLNSADDFAKLAITWQTFGYFSMASGVQNTGKGYKSLLGSEIQIANTIDLSGTGLTGLAKDRTPGSGSEYQQEGGGDGAAEGNVAFTGSLSGHGAINLAVGEPYGMRDDNALGAADLSEGNGKIYRHGRLGLFNEIGGATVSGNVTIGGTMGFDGKNGVDAGALAAVHKSDSTGISGLAVSTAITYDSTDENKTENIGGIFGQVVGGESISFLSGVAAKPSIVSNSWDKGYVRVASAIACIAKENKVKVNAGGITIGGRISVPNYSKDTLVGGFIAYIRQDEASVNTGETKSVDITDLSFDGFEMGTNSQNSSNKTSGGLLGYSWGNTVVNMTGTSDKYALRTSNVSVTATTADGFGGLVYAASGHWKVNECAINLSGAKFSASSAKEFGVLVCRAGSSYDVNDKIGVDALTGLYLENAAPWTTAYKVNEASDAISTTAETFDEWIADTTRFSSKIDDCGTNGVISLHTESDKLVMSGDKSQCNSYVNRTVYGKSENTNSSSRYYYNLDRSAGAIGATQDEDGNYWLNNAEGLLMWSAWRYAPSSLRGYVLEGFDNSGSTINDTLRVRGNINLTGYSYYPVDNGGYPGYDYANITFCYADIAKTEADNKPNDGLSQHSNMHVSLYRNFTTDGWGSSVKQLTVCGASFSGTVGKDVLNGDAKGSGALVSREVWGDLTGGTTHIAEVKVCGDNAGGNGLVLNGLIVWTKGGNLDDGGASPLLVNKASSYTSLNIDKLYAKEGSYAVAGGKLASAATSLFGSLGNDSADMVSASFSNISVPSLRGDSIFTHASLLESFGFKQGNTGSANYIFYKADSSTATVAGQTNVTYGSEIDANGLNNEYVGKQLWYYDEELYGKDEGLVNDGTRKASESDPQYGVYLPYVYKGKEGNAFHEIKVNQRVPSLVEGCGTYGDPYVVSSASQVYTVSNYINNEAVAVDGWEITIAKSQDVLCTRRSSNSTENEITYVYNGGKWIQKNGADTIGNDIMHRYLQSAYYSIEPKDSGDAQVDSIELDTAEFSGFGNKSNPFRGVIVGNLKAGSDKTSVTINNGTSHSIQGLVPYSYGSVVKGLNVTYAGAPNVISYASKDSSDGVPNSFFGGVFGCIMGGDNIIDDVTVSKDGLFEVAASGDKPHLVPVGGYVGAITGGGVIFRSIEGDSWLKNNLAVLNSARLYANPYVGRVIDGYAFSEGCTVDNGDKNYKVNALSDKGTACVETGDATGKYKEGSTSSAITTTVKNAQGLLVLSAIISSGAGGGSSYSWATYPDYGSFNGSKAYAGRTSEASGAYLFGNDSYGKVRNADYGFVGKPDSADADFALAVDDDRKAPGTDLGKAAGALDNNSPDNVNSPYLANYYATWQTGSVCAPKASGMDLQFEEGAYDMTGYGTGFTGLSGRYYSNACASGYGADRDRIVPQVACINGNGAKVVLKGDVKQYLDDDYILQSWGGLFSAVEFTNSYVSASLVANDGYLVKDLQLGSDASDQGSSVSLTCIKSDGTEAGYADLQGADKLDREFVNWSYYVPHMGVGMLAGSTANREALDSESGKYKNVKLVNCSVNSASMSGGLYGNSGWAKRRTDSDKDRMIDFTTQTSPVRLYECSYSNVAVTGASRVGGFVGAIGGNGSVSGAWATAGDMEMGGDSTITSTAKGGIIGGAFGLSWSAIRVNADEDDAPINDCKQLVFDNVTVCNEGGFMDSDLDGTGGFVGNPKVGCVISSVRFDSSNDAAGDDATYIGRNSSTKGLKRVGGLVGQIDQTGMPYSFTDVTVRNVRLGGEDSCGGIVGYIRKGNIQLACESVTVDGVYIDGTWSGGMVGAIDKNNANRDIVSVSNSVVKNTNFAKNNCGGISGDGRGEFRLTNVLFDQNAFSSANRQGLILGDMVGGENAWQFAGIHASGIDVVPAKKQDGHNADLPKMIYASESLVKAANQKSYIAFSDYSDVFAEVDGSTLYNDERMEEGSEVAVESASPYVITNPVNSKVKVKAADSSQQKNIFGDGAAIDTAATIQGDAGKSIDGRYTYTNIGGRDEDGAYQNANSYSAQASRSTFNDNNVKQGSKKVSAADNFPVLLVSGNDSAAVTNYLNLVTNGGFSDAVRLNGDARFVTAKAEQFVLSGDSSHFVKSDESPSLTVVNNGTSNMSFRASSRWDNEESRFTLLTVTFNNGSGHAYKVQVPIIVKRMLEIDFTATYMQGTDFKSSDYSDSSLGHVLIGFGDTMTSYLSWTYNQAKGNATEYGWDSHLESGGAMRSTSKVIQFKGSSEGRGTLPEGTQLTLVDPSDNGKEYHYTVPAGGAASVALSSFEDGNAKYQEKWLSEIMEVKAEENNSGVWVKLDDDESVDAAGAKIGDDYYRVAKESDSGKQHYRLFVDDEKPKTENFYLIVRVPEGLTAGSINGYTETSVTQEVNTNVNYRLRAADAYGNWEDGHVNTPSTYSVDSNYEQTIIDNMNTSGTDVTQVKELNGSVYPLGLDVSDRIKLGDNQYNSDDTLYYRIDSSLEQFNNGAPIGAIGYPAGTSGKVSFYVTVDNHYYQWDGKNWSDAGTEPVAVVTKPWVADGKDMSLVLSDSNGKAISLAGIRAIAKNSGIGYFEIQMKADLSLTAVAGQAVIMASQNGESFTKPTYRGYLSPNEGTLSTSSMMQSHGGAMRYYLKDSGTSTIALVATKKTQLGINVNDLGSADGDIALVGTYDFSKLTGADTKLEKGDTITYTLALQRRNEDGSYSELTDDISRYISIKESNLGSGSVSGNNIVFTDSKGMSGFATREGSSLACKLKFTVKVNTDVEGNSFTYANYRLVLTANLSGGGQSDTPNNVDGAPDGYQHSDYVTYELTKVNTKGIDHQSSAAETRE